MGTGAGQLGDRAEAGEFTGGPVLVQRDGKAIPAQAGIVEKYPDGSAKSVIVRLIIDKLDKDAATELTVEFGKEDRLSLP